MVKDTTVRRILRNSSALIGARVLTKLSTAAVYIFAARKMGEADFGLFTSVIASVALFSLIEEWGLTVPMIRRIARDHSLIGAELGLQIALKMTLGLIAVVLLLVAGSFSSIPLVVVVLFAVSMFFENLSLTLVRSFEGLERMTLSATVIIAERSFFFIVGIIVVASGGGLIGLASAHALTNVFQLAFAVLMIRKYTSGIRLTVNLPMMANRMRESMPLLIAAVLSVIYTRIDIYMLNTFRSNAELGWYSASFRIVEAQMFVPMALVASLFPVLSRSSIDNRDEFEYYFRRAMLLLVALGLMAMVAIGIAAPFIIRTLYGPSFEPSIGQLQIQSFILPFFFGNFLLGNGLIALSKERYSTYTIAVGTIASIVLGSLLVPGQGATGASITRVIAEVLSFVVQAVLLGKAFGSYKVVLPGRPHTIRSISEGR